VSEIRTGIVAAARWGIRNGRGYDGYGWTGSLLERMENVDRRAVLPGAFHGQERGPLAIRFSDESRYQPADVTWLSSLP
jgi:hypothetical protein